MVTLTEMHIHSCGSSGKIYIQFSTIINCQNLELIESITLPSDKNSNSSEHQSQRDTDNCLMWKFFNVTLVEE